MRRTRATLACAALLAVAMTGSVPAGAAPRQAGPTGAASLDGATAGTRTVMYVGNNWDGTADLVDA